MTVFRARLHSQPLLPVKTVSTVNVKVHHVGSAGMGGHAQGQEGGL